MPLVIKARRPDEPRPEPIPLTPEERQIESIFRTATGDLETAAMSNAVRDALETKNINNVIDSLPLDETARTLGQTTEVFGRTLVDNIGKGLPLKMGMSGRFDFTDPRSIEWATKQSAELVTNVLDTTRTIIRTTIAEAFTQNVTVYDTARKLRNVIGLNERQSFTYQKFLNNLDEQMRAGTITVAQSRLMADRQYKRLIKYRAQMIARQEILMAENNGRFLGFTQAVEQGFAHPKSMKRWSTSTDERTCDICMPMNGKSAVWNEPYPNGVYTPPAHIMCRCSISLLEPDSRLAQDFMEPAPLAPETTNTPIPEKITTPVTGLRTADQAIEDAHNRASKISTFQYDAGQIENLNVAVESVNFNGTPHTEVRFKLTQGTKLKLMQAAERSNAKDDGMWNKADSYILIDRKNDKNLTFAEITDDGFQRQELRRTIYNSYTGGAAYVDQDATSKTFTRFMPNGTTIRFTASEEAYAYDGLVRVMIPGRATAAKIDDVMKELGVTANRLPSDADVENLKKSRIISLFSPNFGNTLTKAPIEIDKEIGKITKKYGFTLDDVITETDADGVMRFILPDPVVEYITTGAKVKSITHNIGLYFQSGDQDEQTKKLVSLFTSNTKLLSNTERKNRGVFGQGISEGEDVKTGGADYVFLRPSGKELQDAGQWTGTLVFKPEVILRRTDWFAYSGDSYGVKNPKHFSYYYNGSSRNKRNGTLDYIEELVNSTGSGRSEIMAQHSVDLKDLYSISVTPQTRDEAITALKGMGITEWNGRKIEDVIILAQEYR
jgi:SPP1 gp7 family putative phage head morphogenesis protein